MSEPYATYMSSEKRQRKHHGITLVDLWDYSTMNLNALPHADELEKLLLRPLPFRLQLRDEKVAANISDPTARLVECSDLSTIIDTILLECAIPRTRSGSWQGLYDAFFRLPQHICAAKLKNFSFRWNRGDNIDPSTDRPHMLAVYDGLVLLRGEEVENLLDPGVYLSSGPLTRKMRKWNSLFYGNLPYTLGCDQVFYNLAFFMKAMGTLHKRTRSCPLVPYEPFAKDTCTIELMDDVIKRTRHSLQEENVDRLVDIYTNLREVERQAKERTHLQTVRKMERQSRGVVVYLEPVGCTRIPATIDEVTEWVRAMLTALKHWHGRNLCHGDVQWRNIVYAPVDGPGYWVLIDMDESYPPDNWNHKCSDEKLRFQHDLFQLGELLASVMPGLVSSSSAQVPIHLQGVEKMLLNALTDPSLTAERVLELLDGETDQTPLSIEKLADTNRTLTAQNLGIEEVAHVPDVDTLVLSFNTIRNISDLSTDAPSLKKLVLISNGLASLENITLPLMLGDLDLSYNPLGALPALNDSLPLQKLTLTNASISSMKDSSLPSSLETLTLTKNLIKSFDDVSLPPEVTSVDLSFNQLSSFDGFELPASVTDRFLGGNHFTSLKGMNVTSDVSILYLHDMALSTLDNVTFPDTVTALSLRNCSLTDIKNAKLPNELVFLDISDNKLSVLPTELPNSLQAITATDNQFTELVKIQFPVSVIKLEFGGNKISKVKGVRFPWSLDTANFGDHVITEFELRYSDFVMFQQSKTLNATVRQATCSNTAAQKGSYGDSTLCVLPDDVFATLYEGGAPVAATDSSGSSSNSTTWIVAVVVSVLVALGIVAFFLKRKGNFRRWLTTTGYTAGTFRSDDLDAPDPSLHKYRIPTNEIKIQKAFAKGGFGIVYLATYQAQDVVVKKILPEKASNDKVLRGFLDEILLFSTLDHAKITKFIGVSWNTLSDIAVVMEYMPGGDLSSLLNRQSGRPEVFDWFTSLLLPCKSQIALDVLEAVCYLHSFNPPIIHRDLKAKNVLLSEFYEAKLSDFGVSKEWRPDTMTAGIGTIAWIAPEMRQAFDSDVNMMVVLKVMNGEQRPELGPECPEQIRELGMQCLSYDQDKRPTAIGVYYHLRKLLMSFSSPTSRQAKEKALGSVASLSSDALKAPSEGSSDAFVVSA
ncbi:hypothetical protein Poli38472_009928 [Pythium oligandrum]|uniref:Protein kinase domain-containing protein n=1 Tax=Pythium oligandrum TaxID=41045 RepID=A0A8K1C8E7_PYTOL|nr:hypothetical protein Poli38472_009928 [Pythium oligandrum]|eukprot:TMW58369.1 hypothetical protein Poli38472_009928 [Pythium oligandrum]